MTRQTHLSVVPRENEPIVQEEEHAVPSRQILLGRNLSYSISMNTIATEPHKRVASE
jgi:hypothetical protein